MAISHIQFVLTATHADLLRNTLDSLEAGYDRLLKAVAVMERMIDGDGSNATQFGELTIRFGFGSNTDAKAAYDELQSLKFKLTTNAPTSDMNAALLQVFSKFR